MVKIIAYFTLFYCSLQLNVYAQSNFLSSGYLSLTIKCKPSLLFNEIDIAMPMMSNSLLKDKPVVFIKLNDSTFYLSEYTYGPTAVYFRLNGRYLSTMLLPNETNVITVSMNDSVNYNIQFEGRFKEIFDNSALQEDLIMNMLSYPNAGEGSTEVFSSADDFKKKQLEAVADMTRSLTKGLPNGMLKSYYAGIISAFKIPNILFSQIPQRTQNYYDDIITANFADTLTLMPSGYFDLLVRIYQDSLLQIPDITKVGPSDFKGCLVQLFGKTFQDKDNLFYDMMIAAAYIYHLNDGYLLSHQDQYHIDNALNNKQLTNYIFLQNEVKKINHQQGDQQVFFLPFDKKNEMIVTSIVEKYKDKVIIIDFWATWCGPCIQAFSEMDKVKKKYERRDDVVFVHLTDESSDPNVFQEYTKILGGEHYYVYKDQYASALKQFGFEYIPSYLVFDKQGNLTQKSTIPMDLADTSIKWIESALSK